MVGVARALSVEVVARSVYEVVIACRFVAAGEVEMVEVVGGVKVGFERAVRMGAVVMMTEASGVDRGYRGYLEYREFLGRQGEDG